MATLVRQNTYAAWLDGDEDVGAMDALRSLCSDYEEVDQSYHDFERIREGLRDQISHVLLKLDGHATIAGFGTLKLTGPVIVPGYDAHKVAALVRELADDYPHIAARLAACEKKTARAGGLHIERERRSW